MNHPTPGRWTQPDMLQAAKNLVTTGARAIVFVPIGFVTDNHETILDVGYTIEKLAQAPSRRRGPPPAQPERRSGAAAAWAPTGSRRSSTPPRPAEASRHGRAALRSPARRRAGFTAPLLRPRVIVRAHDHGTRPGRRSAAEHDHDHARGSRRPEAGGSSRGPAPRSRAAGDPWAEPASSRSRRPRPQGRLAVTGWPATASPSRPRSRSRPTWRDRIVRGTRWPRAGPRAPCGAGSIPPGVIRRAVIRRRRGRRGALLRGAVRDTARPCGQTTSSRRSARWPPRTGSGWRAYMAATGETRCAAGRASSSRRWSTRPGGRGRLQPQPADRSRRGGRRGRARQR